VTKEPELGEVEWLDAGPPERPDAGRPGGPWRWYALGFVALAIVVLVVTVERDDAYSGTSMVWTPDGRWLIVAEMTGHLVVVDHAGHSRVLTSRVTRIRQLALRASL
jgi:hypothetical protein